MVTLHLCLGGSLWGKATYCSFRIEKTPGENQLQWNICICETEYIYRILKNIYFIFIIYTLYIFNQNIVVSCFEIRESDTLEPGMKSGDLSGFDKDLSWNQVVEHEVMFTPGMWSCQWIRAPVLLYGRMRAKL